MKGILEFIGGNHNVNKQRISISISIDLNALYFETTIKFKDHNLFILFVCSFVSIRNRSAGWAILAAQVPSSFTWWIGMNNKINFMHRYLFLTFFYLGKTPQNTWWTHFAWNSSPDVRCILFQPLYTCVQTIQASTNHRAWKVPGTVIKIMILPVNW